MLALLKTYLSTATKTKLRASLPSFLLRKTSYSQCGEDLLVAFALDVIHGPRPKRYLDVGANHPFHLSNTALLYSQGGHGTLVEPDPFFSKLLEKKRPRDQVLQCGVHFSGEPIADFYVMNPPTLNTFSRAEMERCVAMGHQLTRTLSVGLKNINSILASTEELDFLNLDIEGMDESILQTIDWNAYRPTCVCVETLTYETQKEPKKLNNIVELMMLQGYTLYADTYINSIFIDQQQWHRHWSKN